MRYIDNTFKETKLYIIFLLFLILMMPFQFTFAQANEAFAMTKMSTELRAKITNLGELTDSTLYVPILFGVNVDDLEDTWGRARDAGRTHEGVDIFASRGMYIVSPTDAVVVSVGYGSIGGNYVYTVNAGGERFYYAHLDTVAPGLLRGDVLVSGDLIGYVGNTGNADQAQPHLHFCVYDGQGIASNPFSRISKEFTSVEKISFYQRISNSSFVSELLPDDELLKYGYIIDEIDSTGDSAEDSVYIEESSIEVTSLVVESDIIIVTPLKIVSVDMEIEDKGSDVVWLQEFLIEQGSGSLAQVLKNAGATGYFGKMTKNALGEYQESHEIYPSIGYYGKITRAFILDGAVSVKDTVHVSSAYKFGRDLEFGMEGEDVRELQKYLNGNGYIVAEKGFGSIGNETIYFGNATKKALIQFQKENKIYPTAGYFGVKTKTHLLNS